MPLEKSQIQRPVLRKETVQVDALGGEVVVRALLLSERLELASTAANERYTQFAQTLARTVVDANDQPIFTAEEWDMFGQTRDGEAAAFQLFDVVQRLSGLGAPDPNPQTPS